MPGLIQEPSQDPSLEPGQECDLHLDDSILQTYTEPFDWRNHDIKACQNCSSKIAEGVRTAGERYRQQLTSVARTYARLLIGQTDHSDTDQMDQIEVNPGIPYPIKRGEEDFEAQCPGIRVPVTTDDTIGPDGRHWDDLRKEIRYTNFSIEFNAPVMDSLIAAQDSPSLNDDNTEVSYSDGNLSVSAKKVQQASGADTVIVTFKKVLSVSSDDDEWQ